MNSIDDIFEAQTKRQQVAQTKAKPFDKEVWAASKKQERDAAFAFINDTAVKLSGSDELLKTYLDVQSRFDRYSVGNALLIAAQMPEATKLADFDTWKQNDVFVSKGSTAIMLLEPCEEYAKEDGTTSVLWNVKKVFDISQTKAERQEPPKVSLDEKLMLRALINNAPCAMELSPQMAEPFNALYNPDKKTIMLRRGLDAVTIFRDLSNELALAHMDDGGFSRSENQFTANCASYILCRRSGVPVNSFSFEHKPEDFSKMDGQSIRNELEKVRNVSNRITSDMRQYLEANDRSARAKTENAR